MKKSVNRKEGKRNVEEEKYVNKKKDKRKQRKAKMGRKKHHQEIKRREKRTDTRDIHLVVRNLKEANE